jgi:hypothetical protein
MEFNSPHKYRISQSQSFFGKNVFGYLFEVETFFNIKPWFMFVNIRYQREFGETNQYPFFLQENILLNIGTIIKFKRSESIKKSKK